MAIANAKPVRKYRGILRANFQAGQKLMSRLLAKNTKARVKFLNDLDIAALTAARGTFNVKLAEMTGP